MIILDLNQVIISNTVVSLDKELREGQVSPEAKNLIKKSFFTTLLSYKKKFAKEFGDNIVLACDSRSYWRKDVFPAYKGHRKHARSDSKTDWKFVFETINELKDDLRSYFKYPVVEYDGAEADDVIAVLAKYLQDNDLVQRGLYTEPEPLLVISEDGDFYQLLKFDNVCIYHQRRKKMVREKEVDQWLTENILKGQAKDNVPNLMTDDIWAINRMNNESNERQKPVTKKFIETFDVDTLDDRLRANFSRNKMLIDFESIPEKIVKGITDIYKTYESKGSRTRIMTYFTKNRMPSLFSSVGEF